MALDVAGSGTSSYSESVSPPTALAMIAEEWQGLRPHIREAIRTLIDADSVVTPLDGSWAVQSSRAAAGKGDRGNGTDNNALAWQLARQCRSIMQTCLREEEWMDADQEFFEIISAGLADT